VVSRGVYIVLVRAWRYGAINPTLQHECMIEEMKLQAAARWAAAILLL
jgi:hypothetical protein